GLVVELVEELQMGLVHVSEIEGDFFVYDRAKGELIGRRSRRRFFVGQELDVVVSRVDFYKQQVDFVPVGKEDGNRKRKKKG
ncbi:MAG: hypothetical protein NZL93_02235, partial [Chthoniobacterales bacterium]|nr:hypothetical protein [Chthoniobacterales bacterium]